MIRVDLADIATADRMIEALYVAAGQRPGSAQAAEWRSVAVALEQAVDALPPQPLRPVTTTAREAA